MLSRRFAVLITASAAAVAVAGAAPIGQAISGAFRSSTAATNPLAPSSTSGHGARSRLPGSGSATAPTAPPMATPGRAITVKAPASAPAPASGATRPSTVLHPPPHGSGPAPTPSPTPPPQGCSGPALTSQSQVQTNTSYCGGRSTSRIVLANGDTWTAGEVTGATSGSQQGAVQCGNPCTLVNMSIHDNPGAFAGIYMSAGRVTIIGGRVSNNGSLGIGGSRADPLTISGVEIDHNGASATCGYEGGGFKGVNHNLHFFDNYVHDNNCPGVWLDINAANVQIDHNRIINNAHEGIFYEISQDASIHDNDVEGNGFRTNGNGCAWLWGGGITIASSFNVQVYGNTVRGNCNGITGTQQNRFDSSPPAHLLLNLSVHGNSVTGAGKSGTVADTGADLTTRNILFAGNSFGGGAVFCGLVC
ncbi:MAG: right-handed parallel beta-helix repeat-containing protein [Candidatus Dormibacteria bacterium]|jgi:hypothetical protein